MQKAVRGRTTMMTQRHVPEIPGNEPSNLKPAPKGMNYCPLSDPKEEKRREIDSLLEEYDTLKARMHQIHHRLHQLGFHSH